MKAGGNMENKSTRLSDVSIGMGGALIITIFVVLCLSVFSALSFTTAYSDLKLANKTEEFTNEYYKIHGMAEESLAEIYVVLMSVNESLSTEDISKKLFINNAAEAVVKLNGISVTELTNDTLTLYYERLGDKNQKLCVTLNVMYDETRSIPYYDIVTWNVASIQPPVYEEENFNLWEGFE